jgi:hypothetical protein
MFEHDIGTLAKWVWDDATDPRNGDLADFYEEFVIEGTPTSAIMKIAVDNAFELKVNNTTVDTVNLLGDWRSQTVFSTTYLPDPSSAAWGVVHTYDLLDELGTDVNEMTVTGVNAAWPTDDPQVNPGGVRYQLCITSDVEVLDHEAVSESAWSEGPGFPGKNWATYTVYNITEPALVDTVQVYPYGTGTFLPIEYPSNIPLASDECYLLEASGTYRFASWGEYGIADAQYNLRDAAHSPGGVAGWYEQASTRLQVWIDGGVVDWQPPTFNSEHLYTLEVMGTDSPLVFTISDDYYGDNSGFITVKIYHYEQKTAEPCHAQRPVPSGAGLAFASNDEELRSFSPKERSLQPSGAPRYTGAIVRRPDLRRSQ